MCVRLKNYSAYILHGFLFQGMVYDYGFLQVKETGDDGNHTIATDYKEPEDVLKHLISPHCSMSTKYVYYKQLHTHVQHGYMKEFLCGRMNLCLHIPIYSTHF